MANFKLYLMDWASGHIEETRTIQAEDDIKAMALAAELPHRPMEVWRGQTKVHRFERERITPPMPLPLI